MRVLLRFAEAVVVAGVLLGAGPQATVAAEPAPAAEAGHAVRLTALDLALSQIVAGEPSRWRFDALEAEASELLLGARDPAERAAVRDVADRIDRFAAIGRRYRDARATPAPRGGVAAPNQRRVAQAASRDYDAVGVLRPVVSKRADAPRFALVDEGGKVTTLVTASPDVDLQPLVGKRIGVRGARGYIPEYKRNYIAASRVKPLGAVRR